MAESRLTGSVRVVGAGLLGTSIGLGLRARGVDVIVADASPTHVSIAVDYGAGRAAAATDEPQLIVVCVPPDVTARVVAAELEAFPHAVVTDVASVKLSVLHELRASGADVSRYVGTHPMAGRERGGPLQGRADLFLGRPWVVAAHDGISYQRGSVIDDLILDLGATLVEMTPEAHDSSVALISHVPQVVATLMARRLTDAPGAAVNLAGQGLRDVTRIAAGDPGLWVQILGANAQPVVGILKQFRHDLDHVIDALDAPEAVGNRRRLAEELLGGNVGVARIPGKHGQDTRYTQIVVMVDDRPGELARLMGDVGEAGVNLEDLRLEHSPGAQIGLAEIAVLPEAAGGLVDWLAARGWRIAG
ncbi:prephenate dehydrogenase [Subtercola sp. Z020]|uniref:prephenate dehydrogenase n=1 Tax=Subtercola sp. Z020 TaxID=2080582 RepID=UPI000CE7A9E9|nr:prephenate dehydrogenase [Subtercola sp. Z020]PPF87316.1 prephenate dehydrogenase [Subtercola sp. Z020]